ncbi:hypothetical protein B296_00017649 [Ensete ventricosum]|uniref:Uncharacterized protein n=1 Tax=Ensete ventricosum TaxID=4639 RepID=A0A426Z9B8_ENSVE|nr:hypothetical protein B296_00017649 [Ensete ventricosum]
MGDMWWEVERVQQRPEQNMVGSRGRGGSSCDAARRGRRGWLENGVIAGRKLHLHMHRSRERGPEAKRRGRATTIVRKTQARSMSASQEESGGSDAILVQKKIIVGVGARRYWVGGSSNVAVVMRTAVRETLAAVARDQT